MKTPKELDLPEKFKEFRPVQIAIIEKFLSIQGNLLADAPTGTGKTIVGAALQRELGVPTVYITPNKSLQEQVCNELPNARMIKGRSNYDCLLYKHNTAEVCTHSKVEPCNYVEECPYRLVRAEAERSELAVLNSSYYLYASNYAKKFRRPLLIVDEIDQFEQALLSFIKVEIAQKNMQRLRDAGYTTPKASFTVLEWIEWAKGADPYIGALIRHLKEDVNEAEHLKRLRSKLVYMVEVVDDSWFTEVDDFGGIIFRPVVVSKYAPNLVWNNHTRVLGMSGSVLSADIVGGDLGLKAEYISVPSTFPVENRPIYNVTKYVGGLNYANTKEKIPALVDIVQRIIDGYPEGKVLVHTHSYSLMSQLGECLGNDRVITHQNSEDRQEVLNEFLNSSEPLVLLSPSHTRGLDLKGEQYQCVIVVKAPFASISGEAVKRRMNMPDGQRWYKRDAAASLMQMCGRGVRSDTDKCDTFILDAACLRLIGMCPNWFRKAVQPYG